MKVLNIFVCLSLFFNTLLYAQESIDTLKTRAEAENLKTIADSLLQKERNLDASLGVYKNVLTKYRLINEEIGIAKALGSIGIIYYFKGEHKKSLDYLKQSLEIIKKTDDKESEIRILGNIGNIYNKFSQYREALDHFHMILKKGKELGNEEIVNKTLLNIGSAYYSLAEYENALDYCQQSLKKFKETGNKEDEAKALNRIGMIYEMLSDYPKSIDYYEQSLQVSKEIGDKREEGASFHYLGNVYLRLFDYSLSIKYYQQALELSIKAQSKIIEASILNNMGIVYNRTDNFEMAIDHFKKSLQLYQSMGDKDGEDFALNNIGNVYLNLSDYPTALDYYQQSLKISKEIGDLKGEARTVTNIGLIYTKQQKFMEALPFINRGLEISQYLKTDDDIQFSYSVLGDYYLAQQLDSLAIVNYAKAIDIVEKIRGKLESESHKRTYVEDVAEKYEKIVLALIKLGHIEEAYNYVERSRSRSFLDIIASGGVKVGKSKHRIFLQESEDLATKEKDIKKQIISAENDKPLLAQLHENLDKIRSGAAKNIEKVKEVEPELLGLITVSSLKSKEIRSLLSINTTILEYFLTNETILIWHIDKIDVKVFTVELSRDSLKSLVKEFRYEISNYGNPDFVLQDLYHILIKPIENELKNSNLIIIPHGVLHYIPFSALQDNEGRCILGLYKTRYLPSASIMKYLIPKRRERSKLLLAFGNPTSNKKDLAPLKFAEEEVKKIKILYKDCNVLTRARATEDYFRIAAPNYDILHLACHAELNSAFPLFSGLLLAPGTENDGELNVHEIFTMDLNAYLVVLSACQTALGQLTTGDDLVGLSRAFIYAGTPSLVASLWKVDDESTSYFMEQFYKNLKNHNKAESLRIAQIKTKQRYKDTYNWASFVLIGEP